MLIKMDIDINSVLQEARKRVSEELEEIYSQRMKRNSRIEQKFIYSQNSCLYTTDGELSFLPELRSDQLGHFIDKNFYDYNVMMTGMCVLHAIIYEVEGSKITREEKLKEWIRNLHKIGENNVNGYAFLGSIASGDPDNSPGKNFCVIKVSERYDEYGNDELRHETFIGMYVGNGMRKLGCPNFSVVYGMFETTHPYINPITNKVECWGTKLIDNRKSVYCIYETIKGENVADLIFKGLSVDNFILIFAQIVFAILQAYEQFSFTHYDLHSENVIVRDFGEKCYVEYSVYNRTERTRKDDFINFPKDGKSERKYYVRSDGYIPTIIDYGLSYCDYKSEPFGYFGTASFYHLGLDPEEPNFFHDIYKFLLSSYRDMVKARTPGKDKLVPLIRYFHPKGNILDIVNKAMSNYFSIQKVFTRDDSPYEFLDFFLDKYSLLKNEFVYLDYIPDINLVFPLTRERYSQKEALAEGDVYDILAEPITFSEFYEISTTEKEKYNYIYSQFNLGRAIELHRALINHLLERLNYSLKVDKTFLTDYNINSRLKKFLDSGFFKKYAGSVFSILRSYDLIDRISNNIVFAVEVFNHYDNELAIEYRDYLANLEDIIIEYDDILDRFKKKLIFDSKIVRSPDFGIFGRRYKHSSKFEGQKYLLKMFRKLPF